jgi:hypothetical protein
MPSTGMLQLFALVTIDVSEERITSIIRVTKIGDDGDDTFLRNVGSYKSHTELTSQKTAFFIFKAVKTSNLK